MRVPEHCTAIEEQLVEYLDGRAEPAERRTVEEHMTGCAECRVRAAEFRSLWGALDDLPAIAVSPAFDASLRERLMAEQARPKFWAWLPSPRLAFAAAALVVLTVWISFMPQKAARLQSAANQPVTTDADFRMIRDLPVLENYDVVSQFDALSELPVSSGSVRSGDQEKESR